MLVNLAINCDITFYNYILTIHFIIFNRLFGVICVCAFQSRKYRLNTTKILVVFKKCVQCRNKIVDSLYKIVHYIAYTIRLKKTYTALNFILFIFLILFLKLHLFLEFIYFIFKTDKLLT